MTSSTSTMTFAPHQSSPLARTISPFKDPRPPPPSTPAKTAKLWDEYERIALENARRRDRNMQAPYPQRSSGSDILQEYAAQPGTAITTTRSSLDFKIRRAHAATPSTTVAICKTCQQPITYSSGICERCMKKIILHAPTGESTPPLSPSARNFASTDLQQLRRNSSTEEVNMPTSTSPKRKSFCPLPPQLADPPIRLSSLRPPPPAQEAHIEPNRGRKTSLTDPNEPFLRLQISHSAYPRSYSHPATPTTPTYSNMPTTPPSTSNSRSSTRPSSLANTALLPTSPYPYVRNPSTTPSEFSALYPYASTTTTSPASLCRVNYALQNMTSAWDDWDSDEEEKVGLVGWMGRKRGKSKGSRGGKERSGSKDSFPSDDDGTVTERDTSRKSRKSRQSREEERLQRARRETVELVRSGRKDSGEGKRKPSGFVRVISCGCSDG